jgi:hypothetical protein
MPASAQTVAATSRATVETENGANMAGVTWEATIRLPENGDQVRVQVVAPTQFDARQLIELQYDEAQILFGPSLTESQSRSM